MIWIGLFVLRMLTDGASGQPAKEPPAPPPPVSVTGVASWYEYHKGQAAAGPELRAFLGEGWRGTYVDVTYLGQTITVQLTDWCQCYKGQQRERLIDLDVRSFGALDSPSLGVLKVKVTRHGED